MFTSTYKTIEIIVPEKRYQPLVTEWLDALANGEIKQAIIRIRWREFKPPQGQFRLDLTTRHPFEKEAVSFVRERDANESMEKIDAALERLFRRYSEWIESAQMPEKAIIDDREAEVNWTPSELPYVDIDLLPPQARAQSEIDLQAGRLLRLVEVTSQSGDKLVAEIVGTYSPFYAARNLISYRGRLVKHFPADFPETPKEKELLHDRIAEDPTDFVTLIRLAEHYGCSLTLVKEVSSSVATFLQVNAFSLADWQNEIDKMNEYDVPSHTLTPAAYSALDEACDVYRQALVNALEGRENELAEAINSFLPTFPVPDGPLSPELDDNGDWWKGASES